MKKILFLLAMLPIMFACSSSDDEEKDEFRYIQVKLFTDDPSIDEALVALYYNWDGEIEGTAFRYDKNNKYLAYAYGTGDATFPISGQYGKDMTKSNDGYLVQSFYIDNLELSHLYGTPTDGRRFIISINVDTNTFHKEFNISKNSKVEAKYNSDSKTISWSLSDYE